MRDNEVRARISELDLRIDQVTGWETTCRMRNDAHVLEQFASENARLWARIAALEDYLSCEYQPPATTKGAYVLKNK